MNLLGGCKYKIYNCHVNFVFTHTQLIQNLQHDITNCEGLCTLIIARIQRPWSVSSSHLKAKVNSSDQLFSVVRPFGIKLPG